MSSADNQIFNLYIKELQKCMKPWSLNIELLYSFYVRGLQLIGFDYLISHTTFSFFDRCTIVYLFIEWINSGLMDI